MCERCHLGRKQRAQSPENRLTLQVTAEEMVLSRAHQISSPLASQLSPLRDGILSFMGSVHNAL